MKLVHVCWLKQQTINTLHTHFYLVAKHILVFFRYHQKLCTGWLTSHMLKDVVALAKGTARMFGGRLQHVGFVEGDENRFTAASALRHFNFITLE